MNNPNNKAWEPIVTSIQIEIKYKWKLKKSFERVFRLFSFSTNCHPCDNAIVCANICWIFFHRQFNTQLPIWIKRIIPPFLFQFTSIRDNRYSRMFIHYIDFTVDCTIFLPSSSPFLRTSRLYNAKRNILELEIGQKKKKICQNPCVRPPTRRRIILQTKDQRVKEKKKERSTNSSFLRHCLSAKENPFHNFQERNSFILSRYTGMFFSVFFSFKKPYAKYPVAPNCYFCIRKKKKERKDNRR